MARLTKKTEDGRYVLTEEIVISLPGTTGVKMPTDYLIKIINKLGIYEDAEEAIHKTVDSCGVAIDNSVTYDSTPNRG